MPRRSRAPKVCGEDRCGEIATHAKSGKCRQHAPIPFEGHSGRRRAVTQVTSGWEEDRRKAKVMKRARGRCESCGAPARVVDHIVPIMEGGGWEDSNLQALCDSCHESKSLAERRRLK